MFISPDTRQEHWNTSMLAVVFQRVTDLSKSLQAQCANAEVELSYVCVRVKLYKFISIQVEKSLFSKKKTTKQLKLEKHYLL